MKIIIASTPKTGNTWMAHLLSAIYELTPVTLPPVFDATAANQMGSNWVSQRHYWPQPELLAWAKQHEALFVTMMRHPGDVLVSLWHMLRNKSYEPNSYLGLSTMLMRDGDQMGEHSVQYVKEDFFHGLYISLDWTNSGESLVVRYEDLWRDPVATLTRLTNSIHPISPDRIESAIDLCDIGMLRKLRNDPQGKIFRKGGSGSWRELPDDIVDVFRHHEPYPALFQALGYTLDPHDPLIDAPAKPRVSTNPFLNNSEFDNGVEVPLFIIKLYLTLDSALKSRWRGSVTETRDGSFYSWLNAPADQDPRQQESIPIVTNLAHHIYHTRADLQATFPDVFGKDRVRYVAWWFRSDTRDTYHLDQAFIQDAWRSWLRWCDMPTEEDPHHPETAPVLTNLVTHIYRIRQDLHSAFPDPFGQDRSRFVRWFITHAQAEYAHDKVFLEPVRSSVRIISHSIPETNNIVPSPAFSLRRKLSSLVRKVGSWMKSNG